MPQTDIELYLGFKDNGDLKAFEELVSRYQKSIINFFYRLLWDRAMAEDLAQEVFLRLSLNAANYNPVGKFTVFLYTIAHNIWIDYYRKERLSKKSVSLDNTLDSDEQLSLKDVIEQVREISVEGSAEREEFAKIRSLMDNLSETHRVVLELSIFMKLSNHDIAVVLDIPAGTVKSRLSNAISHMKQIVEQKDS